MKKIYFGISATVCSFVLMSGSCGKSTPPVPVDACTSTNLTVGANTTPSSSCTPTGGITVMANGGSGLQYQLDGGAFVSTSAFTNVSGGSHTIAVKNTEGCTKSTMVTVAASGGSGITINETLVASNACLAAGTGDGSISINATSATGGTLTYQLDAGAFGASNAFAGVSPGMHTITVKSSSGCTETKAVNIGLKPAGTQFTAVKSLLTAKCGACHAGGASNGGFNFDDDCQIVVKKDRINQRAVVLGTMPQAGPLTATEKAVITNWLAGGGQKGN